MHSPLWPPGGVGDPAGGVCPLHGRVQRQGPGRHLRQAEGGGEGREHQEAQVEREGHGQPGENPIPDINPPHPGPHLSLRLFLKRLSFYIRALNVKKRQKEIWQDSAVRYYSTQGSYNSIMDSIKTLKLESNLVNSCVGLWLDWSLNVPLNVSQSYHESISVTLSIWQSQSC